ncbi:uncharacterized protein LOC121377355 isoform X2 [Gigantopelta aegis]|uniref:uncharacterized protein LOC121377355 isoform X2 n=1 Tax=Gigantopelta aegis TaxID=1735272 RepID=UPI001B88A941|nr:uncharacterized protein LOC121377355 isoform X2 [Gigantopelta aegis]
MARRRLILSVTVVISTCLVAVTSDIGISAELTGSSAVGHEGGFYNFTCTVRNAAVFTDLIKFNRNDGCRGVTLYQNFAGCMEVLYSPKTNGIRCGSGTNKVSAQTKQYHMWIHSLTKKDLTLWWCYLPALGVRSNSLDLSVVSCLLSNTSIMLQFAAISCVMIVTKNQLCGTF